MIADALAQVDELIDNPAFETEHQQQYLDRHRKVPVGPSVSLLFENAKTLRFRVREVQTLKRFDPPATVRRMLGWYESLLPDGDCISAAVLVRRPGRRPTPGLNDLGEAIRTGRISLRIGSREIVAEMKSSRAGDRILGSAFWVCFHFDDDAKAALQDFAQPAMIVVDASGYDWYSEPLSYEVRKSLCADLS